MPRVIGIDPGTVSVDLCGLEDGRVFLDTSIPTADALARPAVLIDVLETAGKLDLIAGPSGYGLPLVPARDLTDNDLRLAYLAAEGEAGGIGGLRSLMRALARESLPVVLTPGVIHLSSVPAHRKVNRVDMGTADKVCAAALAIFEQSERERCAPDETSFILLELGGAFTAAIAVEGGKIVDALGGTSGPIGGQAAGALDGEVAFLAGSISKDLLFRGGLATIAGDPEADVVRLVTSAIQSGHFAWYAYLESALKSVAALAVTAPRAREVIVSGRLAAVPQVREALAARLQSVSVTLAVRLLAGLAPGSKQAAQGAALIADGLAGGKAAALVQTLGIREASGTVLDHLYVISPGRAKARLGIG